MELKEFIISYQIRNSHTQGFYSALKGTQLVFSLNDNGMKDVGKVINFIVDQLHKKNLIGKDHLLFQNGSMHVYDFVDPPREKLTIDLINGKITHGVCYAKYGRVIFFINSKEATPELHNNINLLLEPLLGLPTADADDTYKNVLIGLSVSI